MTKSGIYPMDWDYYNDLIALRNSGHIQEALEELTRLGEAEQDRAAKTAILLEIANGLETLHRSSDAREKLRQARSILGAEHEYYPRVIFAEAVLDMNQGKWKAGLKKLDAILKKHSSVLQKEDHKDLFDEVQRNRGIALAGAGQFHEALPILECYRSYEHKRVRTLFYLGACEYELNGLEAAQRDFEEVLSLEPDSLLRAHAHNYLGKIFYRKGQLARAKAEFEKCLANPERSKEFDEMLLDWLIKSSKGLNQTEDAARYSEILKKVHWRGGRS